MSSDSRRRLGAITALVVGLFVGLTLLPLPVTGPFGHWLGQRLWDVLGAGPSGFRCSASASRWRGSSGLARST